MRSSVKKISVIIPCFNEMKYGWLEKILTQLSSFSELEVICVDSDSQDGTQDLIQKYDVRMIQTNTNSRAQRLNVGIENASCEMLLLHHPRSLIEANGIRELIQISEQKIWGAFKHSFDENHLLLRFTSWYSNNVRLKRGGVAYLDHCIFANKALLQDRPMIPTVDIFEDTLLSYKLRKQMRPILLNFVAKTSSIRFQTNGVFKQALLNQFLKIAFYTRSSKQNMNRYYEKDLELNSRYKQDR